MITVRRRRASGWRPESDGAAVFRWYERGAPTGHVAVAAWDEPDGRGRTVAGHGVWLIRHPTRISVGERFPDGRAGTRLDAPVSACDVAVAEDDDLLRVTLTARFGPRGLLSVPLWFPVECRAHLDGLAAEAPVSGWVRFVPAESTTRLLRELGVRK